jgi:hypothetical protein
LRYINGDHLPDCPTQRVAYYDVTAGGAEPEVTSEITPYPADCTCHPDDRPAICQRRFAASECVAAYRERYPEIAAMWADEGEPLAVPPPPNIGGEGHPDYQGPHYAVPHDRFVPYDVLRDPLPGAAVHIVGNVACVGPLEVEAGDRGRATLDSSREDEDECKEIACGTDRNDLALMAQCEFLHESVLGPLIREGIARLDEETTLEIEEQPA